MPYKTINDLPEKVRHVLPKHAQEIFLEAFNHAAAEYINPDTRRTKGEDLEVIAMKVAWSAVKKEYKKNEATGKWVKSA
jgi:cation transport regulator